MKPSTSYHEFLIENLQDTEHAEAYLEVAIEEYEEDGDEEAFLLALRNVAEAQGGIGQLAKRTGLNREHLYKALSPKGNPRLSTIGAVLHGLGFRLSLERLQPGA